MSANENIEIVKNLYGAFGRGDVAAVLDLVSMTSTGRPTSTGASWYAPQRQGTASARSSRRSARRWTSKTSRRWCSRRRTTATCSPSCATRTVRETGKAASMNLHHWFRLTDGKISYCRCTEDTAGTLAILASDRSGTGRSPTLCRYPIWEPGRAPVLIETAPGAGSANGDEGGARCEPTTSAVPTGAHVPRPSGARRAGMRGATRPPRYFFHPYSPLRRIVRHTSQ